MRESVESLMGYDVFCGGLAACIDEVRSSVRQGGKKWLACINPHSYAVARQRPEFRAALRSADWLIPDGIGIVAASKLHGGAIDRRVTGADVFQHLNRRLAQDGGRSIFFLGSTEKNLSHIAGRVASDWPSIRVAGTYSPPFKERFSTADQATMIERVNQARPDVLWVGLTAPKQEELIHELLPSLNVHFAGAIGAVFDFYSGRIRRPGKLFQQTGTEWLARLVREPRRLWRRTVTSAPVFVWDALRQGPDRS